MANKKKRVRRTKEQIEADNARLEAMKDIGETSKVLTEADSLADLNDEPRPDNPSKEFINRNTMNKEFIKVLATILGTEIVNGVEAIRLVPLSEFVEKIRNNGSGSPFRKEQAEIDSKELTWIFQYTNFITQPLTKGMFIPCDEDGEVMPEVRFLGLAEWDKILHDYRIKYQQAQERVLFDRVVFETDKAKYDMNAEHVNNSIMIELKKFSDTIEHAINNGVELYFKVK